LISFAAKLMKLKESPGKNVRGMRPQAATFAYTIGSRE